MQKKWNFKIWVKVVNFDVFRVMYVLELSVSFLSVLALEDKWYEVEFQDGAVLIHSVRVGAQDASVRACYTGCWDILWLALEGVWS